MTEKPIVEKVSIEDTGITQAQIPPFWYSMLRDDDGDFCLSRFLLLLSPIFGLLTLFVYCYHFKDATAESNMWDALIATSGGYLPVITYIFNRLYESREWIANLADKWKNKE